MNTLLVAQLIGAAQLLGAAQPPAPAPDIFVPVDDAAAAGVSPDFRAGNSPFVVGHTYLYAEASPGAAPGSICVAAPAGEYYVSWTAAREAVARGGQFNVIHPASGNKIDFMIARQDAWGRSQIRRRRREQILPDRLGYTAAPEDVIVGKLWYYHEGGSDKHLRDVAAMLQVSGDAIDTAYIADWARQLGFTEEWQAVLDRLRVP